MLCFLNLQIGTRHNNELLPEISWYYVIVPEVLQTYLLILQLLMALSVVYNVHVDVSLTD